MPIIGSGAWAPADPKSQSEVKDWILSAIKNGFRHIDTAKGYLTEKAVGQAVRESGLPREEIFVTTKLPWGDHTHVRKSFEESFADLDLGYIDLYLMHWPQYIDDNDPKNPDGSWKTKDTVNFNESWAEIEKLLETGKVRAIGVSNFSVKTLEQLFKTAKVVPAVNQVEMHPYLAQNGLREYCRKKGIAITAYAPSGYSIVRSDPLLNELGKKYGTTANQITLSWHLARDTIIIPKSTNSERQKENLTLPVLDPVDVDKIFCLDRNQRICNKEDAPGGQVYGWTYEQFGWW
jgi:diketogulonate reductase-like aldo/keto reductase